MRRLEFLAMAVAVVLSTSAGSVSAAEMDEVWILSGTGIPGKEVVLDIDYPETSKAGESIPLECQLETRIPYQGTIIDLRILDESGAVVLHELGGRQLPVVLGELRLVVEELEVARSAGHEEVDHTLRARSKMRLALRRRGRAAHEEIAERERSEPDSTVTQKPATRDGSRWHGDSRSSLAVHVSIRSSWVACGSVTRTGSVIPC